MNDPDELEQAYHAAVGLDGNETVDVWAQREGSPEPPNDHLLPEGIEVVRQGPPFAPIEWRTDDPSSETREETDPWGVIEDHRGEVFGLLFRYPTEGALNAAVRALVTNPDDPRWRCAAWLTAARAFAFDGVVASYGAELGIAGDPLVVLRPDKIGHTHLFWRTHEGGVGVSTRVVRSFDAKGSADERIPSLSTCYGLLNLHKLMLGKFAQTLQVLRIQPTEGSAAP